MDEYEDALFRTRQETVDTQQETSHSAAVVAERAQSTDRAKNQRRLHYVWQHTCGNSSERGSYEQQTSKKTTALCFNAVVYSNVVQYAARELNCELKPDDVRDA